MILKHLPWMGYLRQIQVSVLTQRTNEVSSCSINCLVFKQLPFFENQAKIIASVVGMPAYRQGWGNSPVSQTPPDAGWWRETLLWCFWSDAIAGQCHMGDILVWGQISYRILPSNQNILREIADMISLPHDVITLVMLHSDISEPCLPPGKHPPTHTHHQQKVSVWKPYNLPIFFLIGL